MGFPHGSEGKESAHRAGNMDSKPGSGRSPGGEKWQPIPVFLPEKNPMDRGAWWATVHRLAKIN